MHAARGALALALTGVLPAIPAPALAGAPPTAPAGSGPAVPPTPPAGLAPHRLTAAALARAVAGSPLPGDPRAERRADGAACVPDLAVRHEGNGRFLSIESTHQGEGRDMLRAVLPTPTARERFEICITDDSGGTGTARVTLRAQATDRYVQTEAHFPGANAGMLRARAVSPSASTAFAMRAHGGDAFSFRSLWNDRYVTVERTYAGSLAEMVRAAREHDHRGERFALVLGGR